mmetsp:Transcript_46321/g.82786  ORF Transcript_46321/g.82786 Transcript_46321/m.82786 type:complete len:124 (-) Transcript_46321:957-1328(-)
MARTGNPPNPEKSGDACQVEVWGAAWSAYPPCGVPGTLHAGPSYPVPPPLVIVGQSTFLCPPPPTLLPGGAIIFCVNLCGNFGLTCALYADVRVPRWPSIQGHLLNQAFHCLRGMENHGKSRE